MDWGGPPRNCAVEPQSSITRLIWPVISAIERSLMRCQRYNRSGDEFDRMYRNLVHPHVFAIGSGLSNSIHHAISTSSTHSATVSVISSTKVVGHLGIELFGSLGLRSTRITTTPRLSSTSTDFPSSTRVIGIALRSSGGLWLSFRIGAGINQ